MKKNKLFILGLSTILAMSMLVGCGKTKDEPKPAPDTEVQTPEVVPEVTPDSSEVSGDFNIKDYVTEEIVDGKFVVKANNEQYVWTYYDDGFLDVTQEEDAPYMIYTVTPTEEAQTSINLIGDFQGNRISYLVYLTIDKDLNIATDYTVDASIMEVEEEIEEEVAPVDEDLAAIADKTLNGIPEEYMPSFVETRMIDKTNPDELSFMIGTEPLDGLEKGAVSEPMMSSIAFSVVTLKFDTNDNAKKAAETLLTSAPKEKWVCVMPEEVKTRVVNDTYVVLVMGAKNTTDAFESIEY